MYKNMNKDKKLIENPSNGMEGWWDCKSVVFKGGGMVTLCSGEGDMGKSLDVYCINSLAPG